MRLVEITGRKNEQYSMEPTLHLGSQEKLIFQAAHCINRSMHEGFGDCRARLAVYR